MKKYVKILFAISFILVIAMLSIFLVHEKNNEIVSRDEQRCERITDYEVITYENADAPIGLTQEYRFTLNNVPKRGGCLTFNIVHQEVEVYIENTLIYSLTSHKDNKLTSTTGYQWAKAFLYESDEGKELRVLIHPIYESSIKNVPNFYYGNYDTIRTHQIVRSFPILILGNFTIILGVLLILFTLISIRNPEVDRSIAMLGFFAIFAGIWKMADITSASLIFDSPVTLSALAITSLPMMVVPYIYFIRSQCDKSRHFVWDILCMICSGITILIALLQLTGIKDLRETLFLSHAMIVFAIVIVLGLLIWEVRKTKLTKRLQITIFCCFLCIIGTIIDMSVYYIYKTSGNMIYCLLAFTIYVILMGIVSVRDANNLIERGKKAKHFEKLAMHDPLTELYNRAYYSEFIEKNDMQQSDCYVIMMDVNNLKICNDNIGHDKGDLLLQNAAGIIQHAFLPNGKCIRMGGDEFCVLLMNVQEEECIRCLKEFDELLLRFNESYPNEFPVEVAYGYASFDSTQDFDFADTLRRADKMMYQMKIDMKHNIR